MHVNLINPQTQPVKNVKVGCSWNTFFFGYLPALFRGDWKWFFIMIATEIIFA